MLDLRKQVVCYRSKKTCAKCSSEAAPQFTLEAVVNMAQTACSKLLEWAWAICTAWKGEVQEAQEAQERLQLATDKGEIQ